MDFSNPPEPKPYGLIQDEHMHNQKALLNEIKILQQEQLALLNQINSDSNKECKYNRQANVVIIVIALLTLIATLCPLIVSLFA